MKRKTFTLVEILVVIGVIAILMGILFPALGVIREKASHKQSITEAKGIHMAVKSFKNEYSYLPFKPASGETGKDVLFYGTKAKSCQTTVGDSAVGFKNDSTTCTSVFKMDDTLVDDYFTLFNTLCCQDSSTGKTPTSGDAFDLNPKKIKFLTPGKNFAHAEAGKRGYRDPWGRPYLVFLDADYDGKIILPGGKEIYDDVAVIGIGTFDFGTSDKISDALKKPEQIVTSWQ